MSDYKFLHSVYIEQGDNPINSLIQIPQLCTNMLSSYNSRHFIYLRSTHHKVVFGWPCRSPPPSKLPKNCQIYSRRVVVGDTAREEMAVAFFREQANHDHSSYV